MDYLAEIVIIVAMLAINAVFASYEMALASVSRARVEVLVQARRRGANSAAYMKDRLEASLAVVQLGITLAGAIAAATGGAAVEECFAPWLAGAFGLSGGPAEAMALALFVIPLSSVTIIFAELVPKMVGIGNKEAVVLALSPTMRAVSMAFYPAVFVFEWIVKRTMSLSQGRWLGGTKTDDQSGLLELRAAASLARATRIIGPMEERIVMAAAQLSARTVTEAMVPARDIVAIPATVSLADALIQAHMHMHTRYPICAEAGNAQSISGYVTFKDIVSALKLSTSATGLSGIARPIRRFPVDTTLAQTLTDMIRDRVHIALVTEGAAVKGLLTMEDIVEELVGDIRDEYDRLPTHLTAIGEGWLAGGGVPVTELVNAMGGHAWDGMDEDLTLAEAVEREQAHVPRSGETLRIAGLDVLVRKVRRNRVAEAFVRVAAESGPP